MGRIDMLSFTKEEFEDNMDSIKTVVVEHLVRDGLIEENTADEWCENHTLILRKKSIFKTLTDKWLKSESADKYRIIGVSKD